MLLLLSIFCRAANVQESAIDNALVDAEPDTTILFPCFTEALGVIVFFVSHFLDCFRLRDSHSHLLLSLQKILTRYLEALPFTALIFVIGMGTLF